MWSSLNRWWQLTSTQRWLLTEALVALAMARIAMAFLPFRRIAAWLGTPGAETPATVTVQESSTADAVGWAVGIVGRHVPWDGRCLAQALAATWMLRRRNLEGTVSFGVCESESAAFDAHAWLRIGSNIVTGGSGHQRYKAFTTFARKRS